MRIAALLSTLVLLLAPTAAPAQPCDVGCSEIDIGGGTLVTSSFKITLTGMGGTDPDASYFPIASLNGVYAPTWQYDSGFAPPQWQWKGFGTGTGQNGEGFLRILRNYPSAGTTEVWICSSALDGGVIYARYRRTSYLPSNEPFTINRIFLHEYADAPTSLTFTPCVVCPLCDEECDPQCRENLQPPDPCLTVEGQDVCAECWCDPVWREDHENPCTDVNPEDGICDSLACDCTPAIRAYLGDPCEDADFDGVCDDCAGGEECPDEDDDEICDECDVNWRYEHDEEPCADMNTNGECDYCEEFECEDDDADDVCNECDVDFMENYFDGCDDVNDNGECDYCEEAGGHGPPNMVPPTIDVEIPDVAWGEGYVDLDIAIPVPGNGYGQYRLSTEPGRILGHGNMASEGLSYVIDKLVLARSYVRFGLLMFVTWVFVTRVLRLLFTL